MNLKKSRKKILDFLLGSIWIAFITVALMTCTGASCWAIMEDFQNIGGAWISVPVFYITDRKDKMYLPTGLDRSKIPKQVLQMVEDPGRAQPAGYQSIVTGTVFVPIFSRAQDRGNTEKSVQWGCKLISKDEARDIPDLDKQPTISHKFGGAASYGNDSPLHDAFLDFYNQAFIEPFQEAIAKSPSKEGVIFLHGACQSKSDAIKSAAELSLRLNRPVLMFDWASSDSVSLPLSYLRSWRALDSSEIMFEGSMEFLSRHMDLSNIHLVAYSLGNDLMCDYLGHLCADSPVSFKGIHMVKPDIAAPSFFLRSKQICAHGKSVFVYYSSRDMALAASNLIGNSVPQLGRDKQLDDILHSRSPSEGNPTFLNVSSLGKAITHHDMPTELMSDLMDNGPDNLANFTLKQTESKCIFSVASGK